MIYQPYEDLAQRVLDYGEKRTDRTGVGTKSLFGTQIEFDLRRGFPLVKSKKVNYTAVVEELLWFLRGETNISTLNSTIWNEWADADGDLGPIYGYSWRSIGADLERIPQPKPRLRDGLQPTYAGVANGERTRVRKLKSTWTGMIDRCYRKESSSYASYGAKGVHVCDRWLEAAQFEADAPLLPGWRQTGPGEARLVLDKDIKGDGFVYSPETCCWVTDKENCDEKNKFLYEVEKDGQIFSFTNVNDFCTSKGVEAKNFSDLWTGAKNAKSRGGFRLVRRTSLAKKGIDQIAQLVDGIKRDPMSRRHIVSAWNVLALHKMRLTPCHAMFQCYVTTDGYVDLKLFQRSADVALGVPFNIASYATLLSLIARATDLKPRRLIMSFGDVHVYLNHVEALREQILRPPIAQEPRLDISGVPKWCLRDVSDAALLTADQFVIKNYAHHPAIKFPIAV